MRLRSQERSQRFDGGRFSRLRPLDEMGQVIAAKGGEQLRQVEQRESALQPRFAIPEGEIGRARVTADAVKGPLRLRQVGWLGMRELHPQLPPDAILVPDDWSLQPLRLG